MADILLPFDFSENATVALEQSILILSNSNKQLEVLHITNDAVSAAYPKSWNYKGDFATVQQKLKKLLKRQSLKQVQRLLKNQS